MASRRLMAFIQEQMVGRDFGGSYRVEAELGQGGVGIVYRALDRKLGRRVALKLLRAEAVGPSQRPRFEREAKALAALAHPNIVSILDCGVSESIPFLAMELLEGQTLAQALAARAFPVARAEIVVRQLIAALAYVHERGLVHRDLKPGNVFLQRLAGGGEQVKLLDFGLAKFVHQNEGGDTTTLTRSGEVFGTPAYMPPEQWTGQPVDARADVYSAAVVCFEVLAGRKPFAGDGQELLRRQLVEAVPLLHEVCPERVACPEFERLLQRALAREVENRQVDATALQSELEAVPRPWLHTGAGATRERRDAALAVRETLKLATDPTLEQRLLTLSARPGRASLEPRRDTRPGVFGRTLQWVAALMRRLLVASAWTVSIVSIIAIGIALAAIFVWRSPDHVEQREVIERALPPLRDAIKSKAAAAKTAVDDAVSDARKQVSEVLPLPSNAQPPFDSAQPALREPARDPWRRPVPSDLRKLRTKVNAAPRGADHTSGELRRYIREHPDDPRGHLLLARLFISRGAWSDAVAQYKLAFARDASSRGDPRMLADLLTAVSHPTASARASELVRAIYGREALEAIERAQSRARSADERARLHRLARSVSP